MENDYYIPKTQEEVLDFLISEKYIWTNLTNPETNTYIPLTFTKNLPTSLEAFCASCSKAVVDGREEYDFPPEFFRIKHLCKEDIESLGFKEIIKDQYYFEWVNPVTLLIDDDSFVQILNEHDGIDDYLFQGTIKNKSELKKVLQMIGII